MKFGFEDIIGNSGVFADGDWVESKDQDINGNVRLIQLADIGDGEFLNKSSRFMTEEKALELGCTFLEPGDVLIARMPDPLGRACVFPELDQKAVTVVDVCIVRPMKNLTDPYWLKGLINTNRFRSEINKRITGTTRKRISRGNLSKLRFDLPPISDQIKIATLLKKVEDLIQKRKESIDLLDELMKSTFLDMFGDPVSNPNGFKKVELGTLGIWKSGGTPTRSVRRYFDGDIPWFTSGELNNKYVSNSENMITEEAVHDSNAKLIESGSLLLGMYDTAALKSSITVGVTSCNQAVAYAKLNEKECNTVFMYHLIQIGRAYFKKQQRGARQKNMNLTMIKGLEVICPSLPEQNKFASVTKNIDALKTQLASSLIDLQYLYNSLTQRAFKGELDLSKINVDHLLPKEVNTNPVLKANVAPKGKTEGVWKKAELKKSSRRKPKFSEDTAQERIGEVYEMLEEVGVKPKYNRLARKKLSQYASYAKIADAINKKYEGFHFTAEMILRFCKEELKVEQKYFTSKELKENRAVDETLGLQWRLFDALTKPEDEDDVKFLELEQVFYNAEDPQFELNIRKEDYPLIKNKSPQERSGVYLKLKA